ncbi:Uncharacterised protein [Neisseria gonorrhoeae]|uniref:Uncharacterized protein n=1 Tax=Neisseria gonorrhoeae TaxID=485 RepID=A0A378VWV2_NEIGO|nr:Uncharacterised protein [Neisseria gonorrhoeae]
MRVSKMIGSILLVAAVQTVFRQMFTSAAIMVKPVTAKLRENIVPTRVWGGIGCTVRSGLP